MEAGAGAGADAEPEPNPDNGALLPGPSSLQARGLSGTSTPPPPILLSSSSPPHLLLLSVLLLLSSTSHSPLLLPSSSSPPPLLLLSSSSPPPPPPPLLLPLLLLLLLYEHFALRLPGKLCSDIGSSACSQRPCCQASFDRYIEYLPQEQLSKSSLRQGLTLVHFSAQLERFLRDRGCTQGWFRGCLSGGRGHEGVFRVGCIVDKKRLKLS